MTPDRLREAAARLRQCAAHFRMLVEREERPDFLGDYAKLSGWPETKAMMLETADHLDRDAANIEARITV